MQSYSSRQQHWTDWCQSLMITATTFLLLACPIALTCVPAELARLGLADSGRIVDCLLTPDKSEVIAVVVSHYPKQGCADSISACHRKLVACSLKATAPRARLCLDYPVLSCWDWSDRQQSFLISNDRGQLFSSRAGSGSAPRLLFKATGLRDVQISADSEFIFINDGGRLVCYGCQEQGPHGDQLKDPDPVWVSPTQADSFAILPDSPWLIAARPMGQQSRLVLLDAATGREVCLLASVPQRVDKILTLAKTGQLLVMCGQSIGRLPRISELDHTQAQAIHWIETGPSSLLTVAPDEKTLITTSVEGLQLIAWDVEQWQPRPFFNSSKSTLIGADFVDSQRLVTWGMDNKLRIWNLASRQMEREICF